MTSKMRMTAAFLAAALCMTVFPVTVLAAGTETKELVETEDSSVSETEAPAEKEETIAGEGTIDEETLKNLLGDSLEITVTEDGIVIGGGESAEESQDDSAEKGETMGVKLEKIGADLEKARKKRAEWDAKVKDLERRYREEENTEIHEMVHAANLTPEQLAELIRKSAAFMPQTVAEEVKEDGQYDE